jgi:hypothetical protein
MTRKKAARKEKTGKGTKPERKAARREKAEEGRGPTYPRRTDRAMPGEGKRRRGPRRQG